MKAYAKINVFLKVVGTRGGYHEIASRFVLRRELFDEISFERASGFALECGAAHIADNIILKAIFRSVRVLGAAVAMRRCFCGLRTRN